MVDAVVEAGQQHWRAGIWLFDAFCLFYEQGGFVPVVARAAL